MTLYCSKQCFFPQFLDSDLLPKKKKQRPSHNSYIILRTTYQVRIILFCQTKNKMVRKSWTTENYVVSFQTTSKLSFDKNETSFIRNKYLPLSKGFSFHRFVSFISIQETKRFLVLPFRPDSYSPSYPSFWTTHNTNASSLSHSSMTASLSSILNQPHCNLLLKLQGKCRFNLTFRFLSSKPESPVSQCCYQRRAPRPRHGSSALKLSRSFSASQPPLPSKSETPGLHHFIAQAALTSSEAQLEWVLLNAILELVIRLCVNLIFV